MGLSLAVIPLWVDNAVVESAAAALAEAGAGARARARVVIRVLENAHD